MRSVCILGGLVLLIGSGAAFAVADLHDASRSYMSLLQLVKFKSSEWSPRLHGYAMAIFWILASLQLAWTFAQLALKQSDISAFSIELLRFVMVTSIFAAFLTFSVEWSQQIIDSFRQAGAAAASVPVQLHPGDMFGLAVELASMVTDSATMNIASNLMIALSGMVIMISFAFIAVFLGVTLIESYIAVNAAVLFMGFGGSQWTREFAITMLKYPVSVGVKLFTLTLIVGLIMESAREWQAAYHHDQASMWTMVGLSLVCAYLSKTIPDLMQALINGVSVSGGNSIGTMTAAGMAFGAGAMAALHSSGALSGVTQGIGSITDSIKSSFSGGSSNQSMNHMSPPSSSGGSSSPSYSGMSSRSGGVSASSSPASHQMPGGSSSSGPASQSGGGSSGGGSSGSGASMAHAATEAAVKTVGTLASMTVPGMEGSEALTIGAPPSPPAPPDVSAADTPENVIRPAGPSDQAPVVDTMSNLKDALNNREGNK